MLQAQPQILDLSDVQRPKIDQLFRWETVQNLTGMKKSAAYAEMAAGRFPRPVRIGQKAVAWKASEIAAWIDSLERAVPQSD